MGAQGHTTVDFGAFPGSSHATVAVTGQAAIVAGSDAEAWIRAEDSADHSADEHIVETIQVRAAAIDAGVGFTIHAWNTSQLNEPLLPGGGGRGQLEDGGPRVGGVGTLLYGVWNVSWCWN